MNSEALYKAASKCMDEGNLAEASTRFADLIKLHTDDRFHSAFGYCLQKLGHWEQSSVQFLRALELKPHYCESDTRLGLAESYQHMNKLKLAVAEWQIVASMQPTYPSYDLTISHAKAMLQKYA